MSQIPLVSIPDNWKIERLDRLFEIRNEPARIDDPPVSAFIDGTVTLRSNRPDAIIKGSGQELGYKHIEVGDLVISGMNAHLGGLGISDSAGKCTPVYTVMRNSVDLDSRFISYYLRHAAKSGYIKSLVNAVRYNSADFGPETIKRFMVPVPPIEEQRTIAYFLDAALQAIDGIQQKRILQISTLKIASQALTLAWIPKDSSQVFLEKIETNKGKSIRAKYLFEERKVSDVDAPLASATMDGVILREDMNNDVWNPEDSTQSYKLVEPGDFVINLRSFQHGFSFSEVRGKVSPAYSVFRLREELKDQYSPSYFSHLFQSKQFIGQLEAISVGIRQGRNIPYEDFANLLIPVPSSELQPEIVEQQSHNKARIGLLSKSLEPLSELRQSLISSMVTGNSKSNLRVG
jgi:type I restriction enzyme, S subunit